jgi:malate synthase
MTEELQIIESEVGQDRFIRGKFSQAASLFSDMIKEEEFDEFLTIPAYNQL